MIESKVTQSYNYSRPSNPRVVVGLYFRRFPLAVIPTGSYIQTSQLLITCRNEYLVRLDSRQFEILLNTFKS